MPKAWIRNVVFYGALAATSILFLLPSFGLWYSPESELVTLSGTLVKAEWLSGRRGNNRRLWLTVQTAGIDESAMVPYCVEHYFGEPPIDKAIELKTDDGWVVAASIDGKEVYSYAQYKREFSALGKRWGIVTVALAGVFGVWEMISQWRGRRA